MWNENDRMKENPFRVWRLEDCDSIGMHWSVAWKRHMIRLVRSSRIRPWSFAVANVRFGRRLCRRIWCGWRVQWCPSAIGLHRKLFSPQKLQPESVNKCQDRKTCMDSQLEGVRLISDMGATPFSWVEFICLRPVHLWPLQCLILVALWVFCKDMWCFWFSWPKPWSIS